MIQLHKPYTVGKLSIRRAYICNFSKIGPKIEKITAFARGKFNEKLPRSYKKDR